MKSRFCPSPTGYIHLGNMRTALFNVLLALKEGGEFLLRIEDTDAARSNADYTEALMVDLHWLSMHWQEGPRVDRGNGPYWQSERQSIYDHYYDKLLAEGHAYHCFCSEEQLALNRKIARASGQAPRYPGTCRHLPAEVVQDRLSQGHPATLRLRVPDEGEIVFDDAVRGVCRFAFKDLGDFIIRRADGTASFMYCNAIDDSLMGVTHALRGEDHLTNTPRQLLILSLLNMRAPQYAHLALLLGMDGAILSKRNGSHSVQDLREQGYLPLAIINYMSRLGHYYPNDSFMTLQELANEFDLTRLAKSPARFDEEQLLRWQKEAMMHADPLTLWHLVPNEMKSLVPESDRLLFIDAVKANVNFPHEMLPWAEAVYAAHLDHSPANKAVLAEAGVAFFEKAIEILDKVGVDFKALSNELGAELGVKGKALFMPLRIALSGESHGPEMHKLLPLIGLERAKSRLQFALYHV